MAMLHGGAHPSPCHTTTVHENCCLAVHHLFPFVPSQLCSRPWRTEVVALPFLPYPPRRDMWTANRPRSTQVVKEAGDGHHQRSWSSVLIATFSAVKRHSHLSTVTELTIARVAKLMCLEHLPWSGRSQNLVSAVGETVWIWTAMKKVRWFFFYFYLFIYFFF